MRLRSNMRPGRMGAAGAVLALTSAYGLAAAVNAALVPAPAVERAAAPAARTIQPETLFVRPHGSEPATTMMFWSGKIVPGMAAQIDKAFEANKQTSTRFVLVLNSGGGAVGEGERVIATLRKIKATHRLDTQVRNGQVCGSMCVFVYLQGRSRFAAPSSAWLFHEVSLNQPGPDQPVILDRAAWERLVNAYYGPAGVSAQWTEAMKPKTINSDYWQTGLELVRYNTGIVTVMTSNTDARPVAPAKVEAAGKTTPSQPAARS